MKFRIEVILMENNHVVLTVANQYSNVPLNLEVKVARADDQLLCSFIGGVYTKDVFHL